MICHTLREQCSYLLASPFIQRIAEAGTKHVTRELKPDPFVIGRAAPPARAGLDCSGQFTQQWNSPLLPRPQSLLEVAPELPGFCRLQRRTAGALAGENVFDKFACGGELRRHGLQIVPPGVAAEPRSSNSSRHCSST